MTQFDAVGRHLGFLGVQAKAPTYREKVAVATAYLEDAEEQVAAGHFDLAAKYATQAWQVMPRQHVGLYRRYGAVVDQVLKAEKEQAHG